jgi:hypothetical protein
VTACLLFVRAPLAAVFTGAWFNRCVLLRLRLAWVNPCVLLSSVPQHGFDLDFDFDFDLDFPLYLPFTFFFEGGWCIGV